MKNKQSLQESLEVYVKGEVLDGDNLFYCSTCSAHVEAVKR